MNKLNTRMITLLSASLVAVSMMGAVFLVPTTASQKPVSSNSPKITLPSEEDKHQKTKTDKETPSGFILRDFNGKIAVFDVADKYMPLYITDFDTAALPEPDRDILVSGIPADSREELQILLEDFGS